MVLRYMILVKEWMLFDSDTLRDRVILQIKYLLGWRRRWSRAGQEKMCLMKRGRLLSHNLYVKWKRLVAGRCVWMSPVSLKQR